MTSVSPYLQGDGYRDPFDSDDDEYYAQMLEDKLTMGEDCEEGDLSSDEDDGFVYYSEGGGKEPSGDSSSNPLSAYEKYKARVLSELEEHEEDEDTGKEDNA